MVNTINDGDKFVEGTEPIDPDAPTVVAVPVGDVRMKDTVHIGNPQTGAVEVLRQGQPVPEWARDLLTSDLLATDEAGALPVKPEKS